MQCPPQGPQNPALCCATLGGFCGPWCSHCRRARVQGRAAVAVGHCARLVEHVGGASRAAVAAAERWRGACSRRRPHAACQRGRGVERVAQRWSRRRGRIASTSTASTARNARSSASDCRARSRAVAAVRACCGSRTPPTPSRPKAPRRPKRVRAADRRGDRERSRVVGRGIESGTRLAVGRFRKCGTVFAILPGQ